MPPQEIPEDETEESETARMEREEQEKAIKMRPPPGYLMGTKCFMRKRKNNFMLFQENYNSEEKKDVRTLKRLDEIKLKLKELQNAYSTKVEKKPEPVIVEPKPTVMNRFQQGMMKLYMKTLKKSEL